MTKKNPILFVIIFVLFMIISFEIFHIYKEDDSKKAKTDSFDYRLLYYDNDYSNRLYDITIKDNKVMIKENDSCDTSTNCSGKIVEKRISRYSAENTKKLKDFIINNFEVDNNTITIYKEQLSDEQKKVMSGLLIGEYYFELDVESYKYLLVYSERKDIEYNFYFKEDKTILTKVVYINDNYDITDIETYYNNFDRDNIDLLFEYISKQNLNSYSTVNIGFMYKDEKNIITSLVENDESYLDNYENEVKLLYTLSYNGIDCETPILRLYDDNTYELFDTYVVNFKGKIIPKTGTYDYDIRKIIDNAYKYEPNMAGPYIITDSDNNKYITYDSSQELNEFLKSINVNLGVCTSQAE